MKSKQRHFFFLFCLLVFIPAVFTYLLVFQMLGVMAEQDVFKMSESLSSKLDTISRDVILENILSKPIDIFSETFFKVSFETGLSKADLVAIKEGYVKLQEEIEGECDFLFFNETGTPINLLELPPTLYQAFTYFWSKITKDKVDSFINNWRGVVKETAGIYFDTSILSRYEEGFTSIDINNLPGYLYHKLAADGVSGYILRILPNINYTKLLTEILKETENINYVLIDPAGKLVGHSATLEKAWVADISEVSTQGTALYGHVWESTFLNEYKLIIGEQIRLGRGNYSAILILAAILALALIGLGYKVLKNKLLKEENNWLSIKYKLVIIFLSSIYMPIISLYTLSYEALAHYETVQINDVKKDLSEILTELDQDFVKKEQEILERFRSIYKDCDWQKMRSLSRQEGREVLLKMAKIPPDKVNDYTKNWINWLDVRDIRLRPVFTLASMEVISYVKDFAKILAGISLRRVLPAMVEEHNAGLKGQDIIVADLFENQLVGVADMVEKPDRLIPHELSNDMVYWYWNYYNTATGAAYISMNTIGKRNAVEYLESKFTQRHVIDQNYIRLFGYMPADKLNIPLGVTFNDDILQLLAKSEQSKSVESRVLSFENKDYVAVAAAGSRLKNFFLMGLYPKAFIEHKINNLRNKVIIAIALVMLFSVFTGLLLAQNFLVPLREFEKGLKALQSRETSYQVKITNKDELGLLGQTFNKIIFEIKDMLLASEIQKCLIPTGHTETSRYSVSIYNKMASDVGGDYADLFALPDNKLIVVVGDVTGHGISSSLLVAMVKASILRLCEKLALNAMFTRLAEMLRDFFKRKKLMSMFIMQLDEEANLLQISSAGHPYPIVSDKKGAIREIVIDAMPLGVSAKRSQYVLQDQQVEVGQTILIYSDGIYEATNTEGEYYGKERLKKLLSANVGLDTEQIKAAVLKDFEEFHGDQELKDDLTLVILKRNG